MAKIGTPAKFSTLKQQREAGELELIIEEFGRAMRNANRQYIARPTVCHHDDNPRFTPNMTMVWAKYVEFCMSHPQ